MLVIRFRCQRNAIGISNIFDVAFLWCCVIIGWILELVHSTDVESADRERVKTEIIRVSFVICLG